MAVVGAMGSSSAPRIYRINPLGRITNSGGDHYTSKLDPASAMAT